MAQLVDPLSGLFLCRLQVKWGYFCVSYIGSEHINQRNPVRAALEQSQDRIHAFAGCHSQGEV
jgi:hypothetical protein